jgi:hypothetical protein
MCVASDLFHHMQFPWIPGHSISASAASSSNHLILAVRRCDYSQRAIVRHGRAP